MLTDLHPGVPRQSGWQEWVSPSQANSPFCFNLDLKRFDNGRGYRAHLEQLPFTHMLLQTKTNTPLAEEAA